MTGIGKILWYFVVPPASAGAAAQRRTFPPLWGKVVKLTAQSEILTDEGDAEHFAEGQPPKGKQVISFDKKLSAEGIPLRMGVNEPLRLYLQYTKNYQFHNPTDQQFHTRNSLSAI